jgi:hypothetical protein
MSESRVRENRMHGSMRRREATPDQSAMPRSPRKPPADPTRRRSRHQLLLSAVVVAQTVGWSCSQSGAGLFGSAEGRWAGVLRPI